MSRTFPGSSTSSVGRAGHGAGLPGLRNCSTTDAERKLPLPPSLTKRLVNHARPGEITEGYAVDWTIDQYFGPTHRITD